MSRDGLQIPRPLVGVFLLVGPVVVVGVDVVAGDEFGAGFADDGDGVGDQDQHWGVVWVRPMPRWCSWLPWRRVSLPNWSTVSCRMRKCSVAVRLGLAWVVAV